MAKNVVIDRPSHYDIGVDGYSLEDIMLALHLDAIDWNEAKYWYRAGYKEGSPANVDVAKAEHYVRLKFGADTDAACHYYCVIHRRILNTIYRFRNRGGAYLHAVERYNRPIFYDKNGVAVKRGCVMRRLQRRMKAERRA